MAEVGILMAGEPFNYSINAQNPVDAMFGGMQFGQQQRAGEQQMALAQSQEQRAQTQFGQQNIMFDQAQQDRAAALKAAMEAKAQAQKMQQDLAGLAAKVGSGAATSGDFTAMAALYPDLTDEMAKMWEGQTAERKAADTANVYKAAAAIKAGKPEIALDMLEERAKAAEAGGDQQEADISRALAAGIKADPSAGLATLGLLLHAVDEKASVELFGEPKAAELPADVRSIQWRAEQAGLQPGTPEYRDFVANKGGEGEGKPAAYRALELQAEAAGLVQGSDEYKQFMRTKGAGDVAQATVQGKAEGENVNLLASMEAKMPGLELVVEQLDKLADKATYTWAGQNIDAARKQAGMEPRPEAVARAEYIAMVDNQVLPLLRDTFGAAFTQKEGDTLRDTLGDPDKSPAEKKAVLRAFIAQKKRDVAGLKTQVNADAGSGSPTAAVPAAKTADQLIDEINGLAP